MPLPAAYHRPDSLDEALLLLAEPNRIPLGGGTALNADRNPSDLAFVDLQALGLAGVEADGDRLRIGATTTLDALTVAESMPGWLRSIARAEDPSTLRTLATVGGVVAGRCADSVLLAALLVSNAEVELARAPDRTRIRARIRTEIRPLAELVAVGVPPGAIVTSVTISATGKGAVAGTGRTPADVPIVAAVARVADRAALALTGVATTPVLVDPSDPTAGLAPAGDFRGSAAYRLELAAVLSARVMESLR